MANTYDGVKGKEEAPELSFVVRGVPKLNRVMDGGKRRVRSMKHIEAITGRPRVPVRGAISEGADGQGRKGRDHGEEVHTFLGAVPGGVFGREGRAEVEVGVGDARGYLRLADLL